MKIGGDGDLVQHPRQRCGIDSRVLSRGIGERGGQVDSAGQQDLQVDQVFDLR
jgi:hypothetical protein